MGYQYVRQPLTQDTADQLAAACDTPAEQLSVWPMLDCGLRVSELCGLRREDILRQQRAVRVRGKRQEQGKTALPEIRTVPISPRVAGLLEEYFENKESFPVGPRRVQKLLKQIARRANIEEKITPHILRHTFATVALQKGISLATVQKMLGHKRLETTQIYLNFTDIHIQEEYQQKW